MSQSYKPVTPPPPRKSMENPRQYQRLPRPYKVEAKLLQFPLSPRPAINAPCYDISAGGLCVESPKALNIGDLMQIRVHVPKLNKFSPRFFNPYENDAEQYVQCIGKVAWIRPLGGHYLVGLHFTDIDSDHRKALKGLIQKAMQLRS